MYDEKLAACYRKVDALEQERDDWKLSFETANDALGKLEASRDALAEQVTALETQLDEKRDSIVMTADAMRECCAKAIEVAIELAADLKLRPLEPLECVQIVRQFELPTRTEAR